MRLIPLHCLLLLMWQPSCKSKGAAHLKATEAQRSKAKACIVSTVIESFESAKQDVRAVTLFADAMVKKAPTDNDGKDDPAFEEYVVSLGCDPKKVGSKDSIGTKIVAEWMISPFNPANATSPVATK